MPISSFSNPIPDIVQGLLQGHQLGLQMQASRRADQQAKTQQALDNQKLSMQDIMNQQMLQQNARPVSDAGTVTSPGGSLDSNPTVPASPGNDGSNGQAAMPATPATSLPSQLNLPTDQPAYTRKADASRVVTYGGKKYELKTPEEQAQTAQTQQINGMQALEDAKVRAQANSIRTLHENQLKLENGGTPAQGLAAMGVPDGTMLTRDELAHYNQELQQHIQGQQAIQKGYQITTRPGEQIYDTSPAAASPTTDASGADPIATPQTAPAPNPALPPYLQPKPGLQKGYDPTTGQAVTGRPAPMDERVWNAPAPVGGNAAPSSPLSRMRLIASGGSPNPTGQNAAFEKWAPGYYQQHGIANPQPKDTSAAYEQFLKLKPEDAESEVALAQRAARGDKDAEAALKRLDQSKLASRPINNTTIQVPGLGPGSQSQANPELTGEDFMKTLPAGTAAQVRAIANGSATMPAFGTRGASALLRDAVYRYDPSYTEQRAQVRKAFTTGKDGTNIGALNTATVHLDQLGDAAKEMANGTFVPGNAVWNKVQAAFGGAAPTNFASLKSAVAGEMANALKGNATDPEIANISHNLDAANSPAQLAGAVQTNLHTLSAKLGTYQERYRQQIPDDTVYSPVLPSARAVFQKYGMTETGGTPPAQSTGGGRGAPGQGARYLRQAQGPNNHMIGQTADGKWHDIQTGAVIQ